MDKPWYKSLTMIGGLVFTGVQFLEQNQAIPVGTVAQVMTAVQAISGLVALYGLRRATASAPK